MKNVSRRERVSTGDSATVGPQTDRPRGPLGEVRTLGQRVLGEVLRRVRLDELVQVEAGVDQVPDERSQRSPEVRAGVLAPIAAPPDPEPFGVVIVRCGRVGVDDRVRGSAVDRSDLRILAVADDEVVGQRVMRRENDRPARAENAGELGVDGVQVGDVREDVLAEEDVDLAVGDEREPRRDVAPFERRAVAVAFARDSHHLLAQIDAHDVGARVREPRGVRTVAATDVQHAVALNVGQEGRHDRPEEVAFPGTVDEPLPV